jgi:hypothetical protein
MIKMKKKPGFLIIGTMKGGTTALYHFITLHPDIEKANLKEIHFFSLNYHKGVQWYLSHFPENTDKLTGEASPTYFHVANTSLVPKLIRSFNPEMKLLLIIRDPVERAVSHYQHFVKRMKQSEILEYSANEFFNLPLANAFSELDNLGFYLNQALSFSLYFRNYLYYESVFGRENIHIVNNQNLLNEPFQTMQNVYNFLDVEPITHNRFKDEVYSLGTKVPDLLDRETYEKLAGLFYPDYYRFCDKVGIEYQELY